jgi:ADP-heptose:LPS heptosyltransferase
MKLLVVRRDNIGDLVCTTPLFAALREQFPRARIGALVNSYNAPVLAGNPNVDDLYAYTKLKHRGRGESLAGTLAHTLGLMLRLRRQAFDYVVLAKSGFDRHGLAWARRIAPRHVVGFAPPEEPASRAIDLPVAPPDYGALHEVEVIMRLAAPLGVRAQPGRLQVHACESAVSQWRARLPALARKQRRWIAFHVSAREPGRIWPAQHCAALIERLVSRDELGVVLLWAPGAADDPRHPGDDARAGWILERLGKREAVLAARTASLTELIAALSLCEAFIGPDGGAMHIAAGLGLPMVALFENNPYKQRHWYPWQVPYQMVFPATGSIADLAPQAVEDAWSALALRLSLPALT